MLRVPGFSDSKTSDGVSSHSPTQLEALVEEDFLAYVKKVYAFDDLETCMLSQELKTQILEASKAILVDRVLHTQNDFPKLQANDLAIFYHILSSYNSQVAERVMNSALHMLELRLEEHILERSWLDVQQGREIVQACFLLNDKDLENLMVKINLQIVRVMNCEKLDLARHLIDAAEQAGEFDSLPETVTSQLKIARVSYKHPSGVIIPYADFVPERLSAEEIVLLYRLIGSFQAKLEEAHGPLCDGLVFRATVIENYARQLCFNDLQKARDIKQIIDQEGGAEKLLECMDEDLRALEGYSLVPHAKMIFQHAKVFFSVPLANGAISNLPNSVERMVELATLCYRNERGEVVLHKDFDFAHLTLIELAYLIRVINSHYALYDLPFHKKDAIFSQHLRKIDAYLEKMFWENRGKYIELRNILIQLQDPKLFAMTHRMSSYISNGRNGNLLDYAGAVFNYYETNTVYRAVYVNLSPAVKSKLRAVLLSHVDFTGRVHLHPDFHFHELAPLETALLYHVLRTYLRTVSEEDVLYKAHFHAIEDYLEIIAWTQPARALEIYTELGNIPFAAEMEQKIQRARDRIKTMTTSGDYTRIDHVHGLIDYAKERFNFDGSRLDLPTLSSTTKRHLLAASICYRDQDGTITGPELGGYDRLSVEEIVSFYLILRSYHVQVELQAHAEDAACQHELEKIDQYFESLVFSDLSRLKEIQNALSKHEDDDLREIKTKLHWYISNHSGWHLIKHAEEWFNYTKANAFAPSLSDAVKRQIQYLILSYKDEAGKLHLHRDFDFKRLSEEDLIGFAKILYSYYSYQESTLLPQERIYMEVVGQISNYIDDLPLYNLEQAHRVIEFFKRTKDPLISSIISNLIHHPFLQDEERPVSPRPEEGKCFLSLSQADIVSSAKGSSAQVNIYRPSDFFSEVAPDGVAEKCYFKLAANQKEDQKFNHLFEVEVEYLATMQGYPGVPRLIDVDRKNRKILMSNISKMDGLRMIVEKAPVVAGAKRITDDYNLPEILCEKHMRSLAKLHRYSNKAFSLPRVITHRGSKTLGESLEMHNSSPTISLTCVSHFLAILETSPDFTGSNQRIRQKIQSFLERPALDKVWFAKCLNDSCIDSYFPDDDMFIDFNAASTSPLERDIAAAIVNLLLHLQMKGEISFSQDKMASVFAGMVRSYENEYRKQEDRFSVNIDHLRFFLAQQLLIYSNAYYAASYSFRQQKDAASLALLQRNEARSTLIREKVLKLLSPEIEFTIDEIVGLILAETAD